MRAPSGPATGQVEYGFDMTRADAPSVGPGMLQGQTGDPSSQNGCQRTEPLRVEGQSPRRLLGGAFVERGPGGGVEVLGIFPKTPGRAYEVTRGSRVEQVGQQGKRETPDAIAVEPQVVVRGVIAKIQTSSAQKRS